LFLEKHGRTIDPATKRKLEPQLKHTRAEFGARHPDTLGKVELEDTYFRWLTRTDDQLRAALDAYDVAAGG